MDNRTRVVSNFLWRFFERIGAQMITVIVNIILARKLGPGPAGKIAIVLAVTNLLKVFAESGMGTALIQKKDPDDLDFSSVFYFNLGFSTLLYLGLFAFAPRIAAHYGDAGLVPVIRVLGLTLVVSGLYNVQQAYVAKTLQFKRFFFATLGGTVFSGVLSVAMVYLGCGIWSLVELQLSNFAVNTLILWFTVNWRPKRVFSWQRLGKLLSYGWKLLVSSFLDTAYNQLYPLIIGGRYTAEALGQYDKGRSWPHQPVAGQRPAAGAVGEAGPEGTGPRDDKTRHQDELVYHDAGHGRPGSLRQTADPPAAGRAVAAQRAVYADLLRDLCLLPAAYGKPERH